MEVHLLSTLRTEDSIWLARKKDKYLNVVPCTNQNICLHTMPTLCQCKSFLTTGFCHLFSCLAALIGQLKFGKINEGRPKLKSSNFFCCKNTKLEFRLEDRVGFCILLRTSNISPLYMIEGIISGSSKKLEGKKSIK